VPSDQAGPLNNRAPFTGAIENPNNRAPRFSSGVKKNASPRPSTLYLVRKSGPPRVVPHQGYFFSSLIINTCFLLHSRITLFGCKANLLQKRWPEKGHSGRGTFCSTLVLFGTLILWCGSERTGRKKRNAPSLTLHLTHEIREIQNHRRRNIIKIFHLLLFTMLVFIVCEWYVV